MIEIIIAAVSIIVGSVGGYFWRKNTAQANANSIEAVAENRLIEAKNKEKDLLLKALQAEGVDVSIFTPECLKELVQNCIEEASLSGKDRHTALSDEVNRTAVGIGLDLEMYKPNVHKDSDDIIYTTLKKHGAFQNYMNGIYEDEH
mgnify:CR=1 FL=1